MDDQTDGISASSSSASSQQNIPKAGTCSSYSSPDIIKILYHIGEFFNFIALCIAIMLVLTYGTGAPFRAFRALFTVVITIVHIFKIVKFMLKKKSDDSETVSSDTIVKQIILCPDVHNLTLYLLFTYTDLTPILTIFCYLISLSLSLIDYVINGLLPLTGKNILAYSSLKMDEMQLSEFVRSIHTNKFVQIAPVVFEMIILVQTLIIALFEFKIIYFITFVVYFTWIVMFNYATNAVHNSIWTSIGKYLRDLAVANKETYGSVVGSVLDCVSVVGNYATTYYKL